MPSVGDPTWYDVLGIDISASPDDVRKAYKQKALETHPDKLDPRATEQDKQSAEARFREVYEAFEILSDPQKRRVYDARIDEQNKWARFSDDQAKRMRDRQEWARRADVEHQSRMQMLREQNRVTREQVQVKVKEVTEYAAMVEKMLEELCDLNPEWEARKKWVQQRQAERAKAKPTRHRVP